jgi:perosamine synthetase
MFPCVLDPQRLGIDRDDLAARLLEHGIETRPMFVPLHTLPPYRHLARRTPPMPVTDRLGERGIMLPTFTTLTDAQVDRVCATIQSVAAARRPGPIRHAA